MIINWNKAENKTITDQDLITEFSDSQFDAIEKHLLRYFLYKRLRCQSKKRNFYIYSIESLQDFFGLAYTSGSDFAGLWNTNSEYETLSSYYLKGFAISKENEVIALCKNYQENWKYFNLGQLN